MQSLSLDFAWSKETAIERPTFVCQEYLPLLKGFVNTLAAPGGYGKSFISIILALHFLQEHPFAYAYVWGTEDTPGIAKDREVALVNKYLSVGVDFRDAAERICYGFRHQRLTKRDGGLLIESDYFRKTKDALSRFDFVVIDPILNFYSGDSENDNLQVRSFMSLLAQWAADEGKTILAIHHGRKDDGQMRGASAFSDASRIVYSLTKDLEGISVECVKGNYLKEKFDRRLDIVPEGQHWVHIDEYRATDNVTFSYSRDLADRYRPRSAPFERLADLVKSDFYYSAAQFDGDYRNKENARSGQTLMILDYDSGLSIEEAKRRFAGVRAIIATTRNHQRDKNGLTCDRFRVIMQTSPITLDAEQYTELMRIVLDRFPEADPSCKNIDRMYFGFPGADVHFTNGTMLFDWMYYWNMAKAKQRREAAEYQAYRTQYEINCSDDSKKRGRDTYAENNMHPGARDVTLYKLAKFAERDGLSADQIISEIYERARECNARYPSDPITEAAIKRITRDYR